MTKRLFYFKNKIKTQNNFLLFRQIIFQINKFNEK